MREKLRSKDKYQLVELRRKIRRIQYKLRPKLTSDRIVRAYERLERLTKEIDGMVFS